MRDKISVITLLGPPVPDYPLFFVCLWLLAGLVYCHMPQLSSECPDNDETVNLLEELQHEINTTDDTLAEEEWSDEDERQRMSELPWWKRPTPWWYVATVMHPELV